MAEPPIIALDLATRTGCCIGAGDDLPALSHKDLPGKGDDGGLFFWTFRDWLTGLLDEHQPNVIVFESPILPRPFIDKKSGRLINPTSILTTRKLQGLAAIVDEVAYGAGIDCREVSVGEVKTALTSYGNATKTDMIRVAQQYGLDPKCSDEADAFGVWLAAIRALRPNHAPNWDFAFGRRARRMA